MFTYVTHSCELFLIIRMGFVKRTHTICRATWVLRNSGGTAAMPDTNLMRFADSTRVQV